MIHRLIASLGLLALGLFALGCGRGAEEPAPQATTGSETRPAPEPTQQQQQGAPQAAATPVSDQEISQFAEVYRQLMVLEQRGATRVEGGEEAETVARELAPQVQQIFATTGLTPERFDEIARAADADEALRARIEAQLGQAQAQTPS